MSNDAWVQRVLSRAEMVLPTDGLWLRYAVHAPRNKEGDDNAIEVFMYGRVLGVAVERGDRSEQIWNCGGAGAGELRAMRMFKVLSTEGDPMPMLQLVMKRRVVIEHDARESPRHR